MKWRSFSAVVVTGLILIGCDQSPSPPTGITEAKPARPADPKPTTQELLTGEYKRISLAPLPLSANAPKSWSIKVMGDSLYFLEGPTPTGEVQIQLAERTSETSEKLDRLLRAAKRDADAHADTTRVDVSARGNLKVFDVQRTMTQDNTLVEPAPTTSEIPRKFVDWRVTYFVPRGSDFAAYELHFFHLTADRFNADKEFLQKILDSVESEENGLGVTPGPGPK